MKATALGIIGPPARVAFDIRPRGISDGLTATATGSISQNSGHSQLPPYILCSHFTPAKNVPLLLNGCHAWPTIPKNNGTVFNPLFAVFSPQWSAKSQFGYYWLSNFSHHYTPPDRSCILNSAGETGNLFRSRTKVRCGGISGSTVYCRETGRISSPGIEGRYKHCFQFAV